MALQPLEVARCVYRAGENDVHELIFTEASREAVDELVIHMSHIFDNTPERSVVRVLVDNRSVGMQPVTYMFQRMREWNAHHRTRFTSRAAVLVDDTILVWLVDSLLKTILRSAPITLRYFPSDERDAAIVWLLSE